MEKKLKRCPFCGSSDLETQIGTEDREGVPANIICSECGACGPWAYVRGDKYLSDEVVKLWNTRVTYVEEVFRVPKFTDETVELIRAQEPGEVLPEPLIEIVRDMHKGE